MNLHPLGLMDCFYYTYTAIPTPYQPGIFLSCCRCCRGCCGSTPRRFVATTDTFPHPIMWRKPGGLDEGSIVQIWYLIWLEFRQKIRAQIMKKKQNGRFLGFTQPNIGRLDQVWSKWSYTWSTLMQLWTFLKGCFKLEATCQQKKKPKNPILVSSMFGLNGQNLGRRGGTPSQAWRRGAVSGENWSLFHGTSYQQIGDSSVVPARETWPQVTSCYTWLK